jgi:hypothetical protein
MRWARVEQAGCHNQPLMLYYESMTVEASKICMIPVLANRVRRSWGFTARAIVAFAIFTCRLAKVIRRAILAVAGSSVASHQGLSVHVNYPTHSGLALTLFRSVFATRKIQPRGFRWKIVRNEAFLVLLMWCFRAALLGFDQISAGRWHPYDQCGYEDFCRWWNKSWATKWFITATFHDQHHRYFICNFGGITMIWDRVCGIMRPKFEADFERLKVEQNRPRAAVGAVMGGGC